jgi:hypothetical protein
VSGVVSEEPEAAVKAFLSGTLTTSGELCSGGHLHACGGHDREEK